MGPGPGCSRGGLLLRGLEMAESPAKVSLQQALLLLATILPAVVLSTPPAPAKPARPCPEAGGTP